MIYSNNSSVKLYGEVADNFLESVGVSIFDDGDIAIGESIFDLSTGCDILEENGVILCEDCIVLEGKQAEEYKARKAAKHKKDMDDHVSDSMKRIQRAQTSVHKAPIMHANAKGYIDIEDLKMKDKDKYDKLIYDHYRGKYGKHAGSYSSRAHEEAHKRARSGNPVNMDQYARMQDASNRNERKQQKKYGKDKSTNESTIFSDIEII